jgi:hypothetical protein
MGTKDKSKIIQHAKLKEHSQILIGDKKRLSHLKERAQNIVDCVTNLEKSIETLNKNL